MSKCNDKDTISNGVSISIHANGGNVHQLGVTDGFISHEWFLIAWRWTQTHARSDKRNFKKPGARWPLHLCGTQKLCFTVVHICDRIWKTDHFVTLDIIYISVYLRHSRWYYWCNKWINQSHTT